MKKTLAVLALFGLMAGFAATAVLAAGDKVRSDNAQGYPSTYCVNFGECPYGDYNPEP